MTGHLVLSTLHTQTAAGAIQRLADMGMEPGLVADAVTCLIAQRLAGASARTAARPTSRRPRSWPQLGRAGEPGRRARPRRRSARPAAARASAAASGSSRCFPLTEEIRALASEHASTAEIQKAAVAGGMRTLREDGIRLCLEGVTTADEVRRVAGDWNA